MISKGVVVHIAEDISAVSGGIPAVVTQLSERIMRREASVQVVYATGGRDELPAGVESLAFLPSRLGRVWSWNSDLRAGIVKLVSESKREQLIFHIHGAWSAPQYFAARIAHKEDIPFVFSAHGMLEPWLWKEQGLVTRMKKRAYWKALAYPALSKASVIHAITPLEREHLAHLFPNKNIEVIPNAIEVDESDNYSSVERTKTILFLGRIEPKKGVDILLRSFGLANIDSDWRVEIVGPVWSKAYLAHLKAIVEEFRLGNRVQFKSPVFGKEKTKLLDQAWVMVVPSHSEVVGLVNLEAATRYLPTITTNQTGLNDWESGGGMLIEPNVESLRRALETTCSWTEQEQYERGKSSRQLVEEKYSWKVVFPLWEQLYQSLWNMR